MADPECWDLWDDSYTTLKGDAGYGQDHDHYSVIDVFPAPLNVPEDKIEMLKRGYEACKNEWEKNK